MAPAVRATVGRSIQLLHQRPELGTNVRARLPLPSILRPYLPEPAPLAGQPHAREWHQVQATRQCLLQMRSARSPARARQFAHFSRSGDLRPKVAGAPHTLLHRKRARACGLPAPAVLALGNLGQRLLDANRTIGQPNKITVIFGRKVSKQYRGKLQTEIEDMDLPNPVIRSHYRNGFIKQYVRDHLILRTEAASNNVNDYGVKKAVENLPVLKKALSAINDNYLNVQQDILETFVDRGQLRKLAEPTVTSTGKRIPGLKLDHPRQLALMHALVRFAHIAAGNTFTTAEIHPAVVEALGCAPEHYTLASLRYDLSKLRAKVLVAKLPNSRSYQLLPQGYSICLVFLKLFERVYAPLTAGLLSPIKADARLESQRRSQLDRLYQHVIDDLDTLVRAVGLKAA